MHDVLEPQRPEELTPSEKASKEDKNSPTASYEAVL